MASRANYGRGARYDITCLVAGILLFLFNLPNVYADSRRSEVFSYDSSGNLVERTSLTSSNPPVITGLTPAYINIGRTVSMLATGADLFGAQVSISDPNITVANLSYTANSISFTLTASEQALLGSATLTFSTALGNATGTVIVEARAPDIISLPSPIALAPENTPATIELIFDAPPATQQTYDLAITDGAIAELAQSAVTLAAGEVSAAIDITGLVIGNTELTISSASTPRFTVSLPIIVDEPFSGDAYKSTLPVGVIVGLDEPVGSTSPNSLASGVVGLIVGTEDPSGTAIQNSMASSLIGLIVGTEDPTGANIQNSMPSSIVGLIVGTEDPTGAAESAMLGSMVTGTLVGAVVDGLSPVSTAPGSQINLTLTGYNLQDVTTITLNPPSNVIVGTITVNTGGTVLTVPISVDAAATVGVRQIIVNTATGQVPVVSLSGMELTIQ